MPSTNAQAQHEDMGARVGILSQRVATIEQGFVDLRKEISSHGAHVSAAISSLTAKMDERSKPQWAVLIAFAGFMLLFFSTIGALAYWPINERGQKLDERITDVGTQLTRLIELQSDLVRTLPKDFLPREEAVWLGERARDDRMRIEDHIRTIDGSQVPRLEYDERSRSVDQRFVDLQRQVDEVKRAQGDTFTARDAILELKREVDRLREGRLSPN